MQLRGPLVGPDRWWYHTLLKGTVRDTLASYGSVPEAGPSLSFDQRAPKPFLFRAEPGLHLRTSRSMRPHPRSRCFRFLGHALTSLESGVG